MFTVKRSPHNPIINPIKHNPWEAFATFNWCPTEYRGTSVALYRAMSEKIFYEGQHLHISTVGVARGHDGIHFSSREQLITPEYDWEKFGCEDPRVTKIGNTYYIFYTALSTYPFSAEGIRVAVATSKDLKTIEHKHLVTPFNAKAMALFPEKINGKYAVIFSAHTDSPPAKTVIATCNSIEELWTPEYWEKWNEDIESRRIELTHRSGDHTEIGAPPIKTSKGWLLIYSHIQHYGEDKMVFGIEAALLDLQDPRKVIGHTQGPLITPEETYEKYGQVMNIVFPSGACVKKGLLHIYYGATDTTCCLATVKLKHLLDSLERGATDRLVVRFDSNPIITPTQNAWEKKATFNPAAIQLKGKTHILYRAMGDDNTSVVGYASSADGETIDERLVDPVYVPRESFERKGVPGGNSGCEDPRITQIGKTLYMCYTAYNGIQPPAVAITHIQESDFLAHRWTWSSPQIITLDNVDDKDACLFPEKVDDKYLVFHRMDNMISADFIESLSVIGERLPNRVQILAPRPGMWDGVKVGIASPPIKTKAGWLLLYHGVSETSTYRVGAVLLDLKNPTEIISRTAAPILQPREWYEVNGQVSHVVFPCGAVVRRDNIYIYYGGGDSVVAGAVVSLKKLLEILTVSI
ncbi:hypothetical protein IPJ70_01460 [Candidatus Campbellbacteria bacterium]|nr:MAG: hypothetical protein IPJ70_01460 [Candidatus Campbellbacteria bacterium]